MGDGLGGMTGGSNVVWQLLLWWFWCCSVWCVRAVVNEEGQALLQFKEAMESDPKGVLSNWNEEDERPCGWAGVVCSNKTMDVVGLNLPRAELQGSLPAGLGPGLPHLRHLNLHDNLLQGGLPAALFTPANLQSVFLFNNRLSGPLNLSSASLQNLDLSSNSLSGPLPDSLAACTRLVSLRLSHNSLSGPIPLTLGPNLRSLKILDLSSNLFNDTVPASLSQLQSISSLNLSRNQLSGSIPSTLGSLPLDSVLDLSNNNLSGSIPRNGALGKQAQAAFSGNAGLCGAPLPSPCPSAPTSPVQSLPPIPPSARGLSRAGIAAIAVGDAAGVALVCLAILYCYWRRWGGSGDDHGLTTSKGTSSTSPDGGGSAAAGGGGWLCSKSIPETADETLEQGELIALDEQVSFDLDELLRASAYVLGKSGVGIVYKVIVSEELTVAVRRLGDGGSDRLKEFQAEVEAIGRIRHANIVSLRAYYWAMDEKLLVYDYIPNGSMASALRGASPPLSWSFRLKIARGTARGLAHLHDQFAACNNNVNDKCAHGDIKASNILLGMDMEPYVSDYGLNRLLAIVGSGVPSQEKQQLKLQKVPLSSTSSSALASPESYLYQAPEARKKPSQKGDVYSFGIILLELVTGKPHVQSPSSDVEDVATWLRSALDGRTPLLHIVDPRLVDEMHRADDMVALLKIALNCVARMPDERPTMRHVAMALEGMERAFASSSAV